MNQPRLGNKPRIPAEISASILAATTAFIGGGVLHLPVWAIFISWAATHLAGGPRLSIMKRLWVAMPAGSTFALIVILLDQKFGTILGEGYWATCGVLAVIIFLVNSALMYTGRTKLFSLVPGMFMGFASMFATTFGGFGPDPQNVFVCWIATMAMNFLGPIYSWIRVRVSPERDEVAHLRDLSIKADESAN